MYCKKSLLHKILQYLSSLRMYLFPQLNQTKPEVWARFWGFNICCWTDMTLFLEITKFAMCGLGLDVSFCAGICNCFQESSSRAHLPILPNIPFTTIRKSCIMANISFHQWIGMAGKRDVFSGNILLPLENILSVFAVGFAEMIKISWPCPGLTM